MNINFRPLFATLTAFILLLGIAPPADAALQYTSSHRSNAMSDLVTAIGSTGYVCLYNGTIPANVATADGNTLIVALPLSSTAGTVSSGVLTFNAITATAAVATQTASHFRIATASNCTTVIVQGSVGTSGSDMNFSGGVAFVTGETISISSFTITAGGA